MGIVRKMLVDATSYVQVLTNFVDLVEGQGPFVDIPIVTTLNMPPHEWWDLIRAGACTLAPMVKHIFAQVCSTSSCERNWSSYSFVHSRCKIASHLTKHQI